MSPYRSSDSASDRAARALCQGAPLTSSCPAWRSRLRNPSSLPQFSAPCRRRRRNPRRPPELRALCRRSRSPAPAWTCLSRAATPPCRAPSGPIVSDRRPDSAPIQPSHRTSRNAPCEEARRLPPGDTDAPRPASVRDRYSSRLPLHHAPSLLSPLVCNFDSHIARRAHHRTHRRFYICGVQVGQLRLRDLFHLLLRHLRHLVAVWFRRSLHDSRCALQQHGSRRRLQNKSECAIAVDCHQHGKDHPIRLFLRLRIVLLAEIHDVHAVRTQRRAHGRRRRRFARRQLQLDHCLNFLCHFPLSPARFTPRALLLRNPYATFSTCAKSSSTGVERPKIVTVTFSVLRSVFTSSTTPVKLMNGPSLMRIFSPRSNDSFGFGFSAVVVARFKMFCTSSSVSGEGVCPDPTNPVTRGVCRTTCHV